MYPFIYIGQLRFGTYGICLVTGFFVGYYILRAELARRDISRVNPLVVVFTLGIGALLFSKLYWSLQQFGSRPFTDLLTSRSGFTFYGGLLADLVLVAVLAARYSVPMLALADSLSAACALGYGIGRIGCFLAGDGDYGIPTNLPWGMRFPHGLVPTLVPVHPAPLYEFGSSALIALLLWELGTSRPGRSIRPGRVFGVFLVATGLARFLVEFIKRNDRVLWGLGNAQLVGLLSVLAGAALLYAISRRGSRSRGIAGPRINAPIPLN
jgi:phosphatidylglycerol---prolipoprotein diacylglyceryl transferase